MRASSATGGVIIREPPRLSNGAARQSLLTLRGLQGAILASAMQEDAPDADRASVLSLAALLFRLAFFGVGPPVGALVDRAGMEAALVVLAGVFGATGLAALVLFNRAHGHGARAARL